MYRVRLISRLGNRLLVRWDGGSRDRCRLIYCEVFYVGILLEGDYMLGELGEQ